MKKYIDNVEKLNKKSFDLNLKNKQRAFCSNLPFGILSFSSYVDIKSMNIISSNVRTTGYQFLGTKSDISALKILKNDYDF